MHYCSHKKAFDKSRTKGFTLIELLVVIAIIALLSSIVLSSLSTAKDKAAYVRASTDAKAFESALELYYQNNQDWPPANARLIAYSSNPTDWNTLGTYLRPYMSTFPYPVFPSKNGSGNLLLQGYAYIKGTTASPVEWKTFDGVTNQFVGCIIMRDGYYMDFTLPKRNDLSFNDGGIDPEGVEIMSGDYTVYHDLPHCP